MADNEETPDVDLENDADVTMEGAEADDSLAIPDIAEPPAKRIRFLDYLRSPIVQLVVGSGDNQAIISAHQDLLTKSPYFEKACADFTGSTVRRINLLDEDTDAMGSFVEYLYIGDYFPKKLGSGRDAPLETDPSYPVPDNTGDQLLQHARIYNIAEKFNLPALKSLAHSKIHRTTSTARGEIQFARYVYSNVPVEDTNIRRPVAAFWATRSHVLRHEAEAEFKAMCLEFPQFGFDVLTLVLDQKEKGKGQGTGGEMSVSVGTPATGRKRQRNL